MYAQMVISTPTETSLGRLAPYLANSHAQHDGHDDLSDEHPGSRAHEQRAAAHAVHQGDGDEGGQHIHCAGTARGEPC